MMDRVLLSCWFFLCWLILLTIVMGVLGSLLPQFFSLLILFPYVIAFFLMAQRYVKKYQHLPDIKQRWQLSIGCVTLFWLYSIVAGWISLMIAQGGEVDIQPLLQVLSHQTFVIFFTGLFLCVNALLVALGYWFLGKPTAKMLAHQQNSQQ